METGCVQQVGLARAAPSTPDRAIDISEIRHERGRFRRHLRREAVGIGLLLAIAAEAGSNGVFVVRAGASARDEDFPDAAGAGAHGMWRVSQSLKSPTTLTTCVRRPDREANACDALASCEVAAEHVVLFEIRTFGMKMEIEIRDDRRKAVNIFGFPDLVVMAGEAKFIVLRPSSQFSHKKARGVNALAGYRFAPD